MQINELFGQGRTVFSCEVFPPKATSPVDTIYKTLDGLKEIRPDYISVTFGAGGSEVNQSTREIAGIIQKQYGIPAVAHLTCVNYSRDEVADLLSGLRADGIDNILALRGDRNPEVEPKTDFQYASQLIRFIRERDGQVGISAACYPEGHPESASMVDDLRHLKEKVDAGAQRLVSQLFFDNDDFFEFVEKARIAGITVPIQAGIMPVLNRKSIERMVALCGASLPRKLTRILSRYGDHPQAMREAGIAYAIDQISDLIAGGVDGIHLYTMNNPDVARRIADSIASIRAV